MRNYKNWLRGYVEYMRYNESPDYFHFWAGIYALSSVAQRKLWIPQGYFDWVPNFYMIFVGPPEIVKKSTTIDGATRLLREVPGVNFGPDSITWQAFSDALAEVNGNVPYTDPVTKEELYLPMAAITCGISELGTFLATDDSKMTSVLIDLWDGKLRQWQHRTRGNVGGKIQNPCPVIAGATTPSWVRDNIPASMLDGGLISRIVFIYGDQKQQSIPYPSRIIPKGYIEECTEKLVEDLIHISNLKGPMHLTEEAYEWGDAWYKARDVDNAKLGPLNPTRLRRARAQTYLHKIAMLLSIAQRDTLEITVDDLRAADGLMKSLEPHADKVFLHIGGSLTSKHMDAILLFLGPVKEIGLQDLWKHCRYTMSLQDFNDALSGGAQAGLWQQQQQGSEVVVKLHRGH